MSKQLKNFMVYSLCLISLSVMSSGMSTMVLRPMNSYDLGQAKLDIISNIPILIQNGYQAIYTNTPKADLLKLLEEIKISQIILEQDLHKELKNIPQRLQEGIRIAVITPADEAFWLYKFKYEKLLEIEFNIAIETLKNLENAILERISIMEDLEKDLMDL